MTNVLFIGPYRQLDGWGLASIDYIRAISTNKDINLTTRPIYLSLSNTNQQFDDQEIIGYENSHYKTYDVVIQKVLPEYLYYDNRFKKNIGLFTLEISNLKNTNAIENINRMDEIWVPSQIEAKSLLDSGVFKKIRAISQPIDINDLDVSDLQKIQFGQSVDNTFKFYSIFELTERKNFTDLITAFNLAFTHTDNVSLIIKTRGDINQIKNECNRIKKSLNINKKYKEEIIITNTLSRKQILQLHHSCDCYVCPSYGEAFCRPAAEALLLGKNPIINKNIGTNDIVDDENGFLVKSHKVPVILNQHPVLGLKDYYNANQHWFKIDVYDLIDKMRKAFEMYSKDEKEWIKKSNIGMSQKDSLSYKSIGNKLCI